MKSLPLLSDTVILSSKGQLVVPYLFREKMGVHSGMKLFLTIRKDGVLEIKPMKQSIEAFFGCCKRHTKKKPMTIEEMDAAIMKAVSE